MLLEKSCKLTAEKLEKSCKQTAERLEKSWKKVATKPYKDWKKVVITMLKRKIINKLEAWKEPSRIKHCS